MREVWILHFKNLICWILMEEWHCWLKGVLHLSFTQTTRTCNTWRVTKGLTLAKQDGPCSLRGSSLPFCTTQGTQKQTLFHISNLHLPKKQLRSPDILQMPHFVGALIRKKKKTRDSWHSSTTGAYCMPHWQEICAGMSQSSHRGLITWAHTTPAEDTPAPTKPPAPTMQVPVAQHAFQHT